MRITESILNGIVKYINTLESRMHPYDSQSFNGNLWRIDYLPHEGVFIRRGFANPTHSSKRLTMRDSFMFLTAIQYMLEVESHDTSSLR